MKKLLIIAALLSFCIGAGAQEKIYEVKSGKVTMEMEMMGQVMVQDIYFDDYGAKQVTASNFQGQKMRILVIDGSNVMVNDADKTLMVYHNLYDSWSWIGGHADGMEDLCAVAMKELQEETGVKHARLVSDEVFSLETLTVNGHVRKGIWVPSHLHFNLTYLAEAEESEALTVQEEENSIGWGSKILLTEDLPSSKPIISTIPATTRAEIYSYRAWP